MTDLRDRVWTGAFLRIVWLLPLAFAVHEAEEWNILRWYRAHWINVGDLTTRTVRTHLVLVSVLGVLVTGAAVAFRRPRVAAVVVLIYFGGYFTHSFLHVYWVPYFGAYSPGIVTAVCLLVPAYVVVAARAIRDELVPMWFVVAVVVLSLYVVLFGIGLGNAMPDGGLPWYQRAEVIAELLRGPA